MKGPLAGFRFGRRALRSLLALGAAGLTCASLAAAQETTTGSIAGRVIDQQTVRRC